MKQLWYCEPNDFGTTVSCIFKTDDGRDGGVTRSIAKREFDAMTHKRMYLENVICAMLHDVEQMVPPRSAIVARIEHAIRTYHFIAGTMPNVLYVGHAEYRSLPISTGQYRVEGRHREYWGFLRIVRVDLPEWLQVSRVEGAK